MTIKLERLEARSESEQQFYPYCVICLKVKQSKTRVRTDELRTQRA